jgi:integrase
VRALGTAARTLPVMELRPGLKDVRRPAELMHAYITLSLLTGIRTEEARALRWAHVDLDGDPAAAPPVPPHVAVWRSVRVHGETKTERSRRTLGLPAVAVHALRAWSASQAGERLAAGDDWQDTGLAFTTHLGAALDAANVRKMFKRVCTQAGVGEAGPRASCGPPSSACSATAGSASRRSPAWPATPPPAPPRSSTAANCDPPLKSAPRISARA